MENLDFLKNKLIELLFEKAKNESKLTNKTALSKFLEAETNFQLKEKTLTRAYDRYINQNHNQPKLSQFNLNHVASYLGYENFATFCEMNTEPPTKEINRSKSNDIKPKKTSTKNWLLATGFFSTLGIGAFTYHHNTQPECMYWQETEFVKIDCQENLHPTIDILPYNEQTFLYLKRIEPTSETLFFKAGKPQIWYLKVDGEIEFYSSDGKHPINDKDLKPVTPYIVNKYVASK